MKKLIIAAAIVCAATISQAASVGWTCMGTSAFSGGDYSIFVINKNGVTGVDQIKAIVEASGLAAASAYAFDTGTVTSTASKAAATSGKSITYSGSGTDTYQAFIFVEDADGAFASFTSTASISMADDSTSRTFGFANQATTLGNNKFEVGGTPETPEPTSGLLLLLGVAGLALRRRRA